MSKAGTEPEQPQPRGDGPASDGTPYPSSSVAGAVLLTIFLPFIALIASLLLRGSQSEPARKRQLSTWSLAAGGYLVVTGLIGVLLFASLSSGHTDTEGPCVGGPKLGAAGVSLGDDRYRFPCAISGSTIERFP